MFWTLIDHDEEYHDERSQVYVRPFETQVLTSVDKICSGTCVVYTFDRLPNFRHLYPVKYRAGTGVETGSYVRIKRS